MSNRNSKVEHEFAKKRKKARPLNNFDVMSPDTRQKVGVPGRVWPRKDFSKKWKLILKSVQWISDVSNTKNILAFSTFFF